MSYEQAQAQVGSIVELIEALDVDYDRLAELRDAAEKQRSVSSGTHRLQDLVPVFMRELAAVDAAAYEQLMINGGGVPAHVYGDDCAWWDSEDAAALLAELFDTLNNNCDEGIYFGAHCGNGSDFGYWLTEEAADELDELTSAAGEYGSRDDVEEAINNDPLSIEYRSGWTLPGVDMEPDEYRVVLCTGGPQVELRGVIGHDDVRVVWRDWGTSGEYFPTSGELDALRQYVAALGVHVYQF